MMWEGLGGHRIENNSNIRCHFIRLKHSCRARLESRRAFPAPTPLQVDMAQAVAAIDVRMDICCLDYRVGRQSVTGMDEQGDMVTLEMLPLTSVQKPRWATAVLEKYGGGAPWVGDPPGHDRRWGNPHRHLKITRPSAAMHSQSQ